MARRKEDATERKLTSKSYKTIFSWIMDRKMVKRKDKVGYMDPTSEIVKLEGGIRRDGIKCHCCKKVVSGWTFEKHAGFDHLRKPYDNIVVLEADGKDRPLSSFLNEAWLWEKPADDMRTTYRPLKKYKDNHDNVCIVCAEGGNVTCCDGCSSTYHNTCMGMEVVPEDKWYCPYCVCKFCGGLKGDRQLWTCFQCEKKFHFRCSGGCTHRLQREKAVTDNAGPSLAAFCGLACRKIYDWLQANLGLKHKLRGKLSWTMIRRMDPRAGAYSEDPHQRLECNLKAVMAWKMLDECFETLRDELTGADIIKNTVLNLGFRANYPRLNHSNFYTVILERDEEIVSAATVRIIGSKLAEMPFIATRAIDRRRKMSRKVVAAVELILRSLGVETLLIPSVTDLTNMWKNKYFFNEVGEELMRELSQWNMLMLHSTVRLQKSLISPDSKQVMAAGAMEKEVLDNSGAQSNSYLTAAARVDSMAASTSGTKEVNEANNNEQNSQNNLLHQPILPDLNEPLETWARSFDLNELPPEAEV